MCVCVRCDVTHLQVQASVVILRLTTVVSTIGVARCPSYPYKGQFGGNTNSYDMMFSGTHSPRGGSRNEFPLSSGHTSTGTVLLIFVAYVLMHDGSHDSRNGLVNCCWFLFLCMLLQVHCFPGHYWLTCRSGGCWVSLFVPTRCVVTIMQHR